MTQSSIDGFSTASQMLQALRQRQLSAVELLALHQRRIERYNPQLNAIIIACFEQAREAAEAADAARERGADAALLEREFGGFRRPPGYDDCIRRSICQRSSA